MLQGIDALNDKQKRYATNIQKSGRVLLEMINDILDLAKMEAGKMEIRPSEFRIDTLVQAQCDMVRSLAEDKNIDLVVNVESESAGRLSGSGKAAADPDQPAVQCHQVHSRRRADRGDGRSR